MSSLQSPARRFLVLALPVLAALAGWTLAQPPASSPAAPGQQVIHIAIDSAIHPVTEQYLEESLAHADEIGAQAVIVELNTPGGLLTSTREMFKAMLGARTPVVVYVAPGGAQAASAGFFLLMAADVAAMAPGTNTGAAHPVGGQGEDIEGHMGDKIEQDSAATIRSLAKQHGRNVELAEKAVVESRSFTAEEALASGLIEIIAPDLTDLLRQLDGREIEKMGEQKVALQTGEATVEKREMRVFQRILAAIAHPNIAYILMAIGWLGLYMELSNPGTILPGVVGGICLILAFYSLSVLPVNYAGVALILLAMVFFIAEIKVVSYGMLSVGGVISLVLGSLMLFKDAGPALRLGLELIIGVSGSILLVVGLLMLQVLRVRRAPVLTGREGLLSEVGVVRTELAPRGKVFVHGELWHAVAEEPIAAGCEVEVISIDGLTLHVRRAAGAALRAPGRELS